MKKIIFTALSLATKESVTGYYVFCRSHHYILQEYNSSGGYDERWETSEWVEIDADTLVGTIIDNRLMVLPIPITYSNSKH